MGFKQNLLNYSPLLCPLMEKPHSSDRNKMTHSLTLLMQMLQLHLATDKQDEITAAQPLRCHIVCRGIVRAVCEWKEKVFFFFLSLTALQVEASCDVVG